MHTDEDATHLPDNATVSAMIELFAMLSDPTRLRIVIALGAGEHSVSQLAAIAGKSPTAVSQHLAKLRLARVVIARNEGTRVYYRITNEHVTSIVSNAMDQADHILGLPQDAMHQQRGRALS